MDVLRSDLQLLDTLAHAAFLLDGEGEILAVNRAAIELGGDLTGSRFGEVMLDQTERGGFEEVLRLARSGIVWNGQLHLPAVTPDELTDVQVTPLRDHDGVGQLLVVAETPPRRIDHRLADRLTRLARVTTELLHADDVESLNEIVIHHLADAAGATTASLSTLVDDDTLALVGLRGGSPGAELRFATYPVDGSTPAGEAVRSHQTLVMVGREDISGRFPDLPLAAEGERSMVCLPLLVAGRPIGVTTLSFPYRREFDRAELEFLRLLADQAAQALERIRAVRASADQAAKLEFVAEASAELAASLDYEATLRKVAWLAVPRFADWCVISLADNGVLRVISVAHPDPETLALAEEYLRRYPPDPELQIGSYQVLRTGESELIPEITDEILAAAAKEPEQLDLLRRLSFRSGLIVPLKARGRTFGTVTWVSGRTGRRFEFSDVSFGEDLARRAATAIDNALLHRELREVADHLQAAVRPPALPRGLPGWEFAAAYSSSGRTEVGGDFYDVIPLEDQRLVFFIGDVMGRGVQAAAAMSQIRTAVRTLAAVDPEPASVLTRLDRLFDQYPTDQLVTLVYGVLDPGSDELVLAAAGHPPPLVLAADGSAVFVESARGRILGAGGGPREATVVPFEPGQTLVAYTDGLLERRREDLEISKQRLLRSAHRLSPDADLELELPGLVADVSDASLEDDLAVLVVRRTPGRPGGDDPGALPGQGGGG